MRRALWSSPAGWRRFTKQWPIVPSGKCRLVGPRLGFKTRLWSSKAAEWATHDNCLFSTSQKTREADAHITSPAARGSIQLCGCNPAGKPTLSYSRQLKTDGLCSRQLSQEEAELAEAKATQRTRRHGEVAGLDVQWMRSAESGLPE